ncbi:MAG: tetratricopeptide repeat protein [Planctomycetes bacterium]|nr:tetratricopeptide repeat protein [Planctomycetota bacterium]
MKRGGRDRQQRRGRRGKANRPNTARRLRWWEVPAGLVVITGWAYLLLGPSLAVGNRAQISFPRLEIRTDPSGSQFVQTDAAALRAAFEHAGLPDPSDLNGADPVPVAILLRFAREWVDTRSVAALGQLGQVYQALQEHEAALGCFAAAAQLDTSDVRWRYGLGIECQAMALTDLAIDALDQARRMDPDYPTTYARLGALYLDRKDFERAEAQYNEYRMRLPNRSLGYVGLGRVALARGDEVRAKELLSTAVRVMPNDFLAHRLLGRALAALGRHELARREQDLAERLPQYSGWLSFDPRLQESNALANTQGYLTNQMRAAATGEDWATFVHVAELLLRRRPQDFSTLGNLAEAYRKLGRLDKAEALADRAIELKPDYALAYANRGWCYQQLAQYERAIADYTKAIGLDPKGALAYVNRGVAHVRNGQDDKAVADWEKVLTLNPRDEVRELAENNLLSIRREATRPFESKLKLPRSHFTTLRSVRRTQAR